MVRSRQELEFELELKIKLYGVGWGATNELGLCSVALRCVCSVNPVQTTHEQLHLESLTAHRLLSLGTWCSFAGGPMLLGLLCISCQCFQHEQ